MITERFLELSVRERLGLVIAIGAILAVGAERLVFSPAIKQIQMLDRRIESERKLEAKHRSVLAVEEDVLAGYERVRDRLGESGDPAEMNEQLKQRLDELGVACGLTLRARKHKNHVPERFVVTYVVEISEFEGEVEALVDMLQRIEEADGLLRIEQLSVKAEADTGRVSGSMRITQVMTHTGETQSGEQI
jgi:type II secretory pathway component PulM